MSVDPPLEGAGHRFCLHASQVLQRALILGQPRDKSNLRAYTDSFDARSLFRRGIRYTTKSCMRSFMYDGECSREMTSLEQAPRVQDANANIGEICAPLVLGTTTIPLLRSRWMRCNRTGSKRLIIHTASLRQASDLSNSWRSSTGRKKTKPETSHRAHPIR
jgi:hypothetical protein